ncbi:hypothetical protein BGX27_009940 [Mortierella sp. AM989]|nr:hypothetical protein BGX27_009940 [Mortierella sp. AM989]
MDFSIDEMTLREDLDLDFPSYDTSIWSDFLNVIVRNSRLHRIGVDLCYCEIPQIMEEISHCRDLKIIDFIIRTLDSETAKLLFSSCTYLQELRLKVGERSEVDLTLVVFETHDILGVAQGKEFNNNASMDRRKFTHLNGYA